MKKYRVVLEAEYDEDFVKDADQGMLFAGGLEWFIRNQLDWDEYENPTGFDVVKCDIEEIPCE